MVARDPDRERYETTIRGDSVRPATKFDAAAITGAIQAQIDHRKKLGMGEPDLVVVLVELEGLQRKTAFEELDVTTVSLGSVYAAALGAGMLVDCAQRTSTREFHALQVALGAIDSFVASFLRAKAKREGGTDGLQG